MAILHVVSVSSGKDSDDTDFDFSIVKSPPVRPCREQTCPVVGQALREHHAVPKDQYLAGLEVIERCTRENVAGCPSFFACIGDLTHGRLHG